MAHASQLCVLWSILVARGDDYDDDDDYDWTMRLLWVAMQVVLKYARIRTDTWCLVNKSAITTLDLGYLDNLVYWYLM